MKCLITGGAGFIGSHLADRLIADGHEVICVDNLVTGSKENISHLFKSAKFSFIEHDCVLPLPEKITAELIFHLASPASPPKYQALAEETLLVNTVGTYHLLVKARKWGAKIIFASTSEVYGDPAEHPQTENYWGNVNPVGERSCYDESKRAGESFVMTFVRKYRIDGRIARIFNTYGPRMNIADGRVVTNFIQEIMNGTALTINGDGKQTRSFCYVSDLVEGLVRLAVTPDLVGRIVNLGNPIELTILELADRLKKLTDYEGGMTFNKMPADDPVRRKPDISLAKKLLDWTPKIDLDLGLRLTLEYFNTKKH